MKTEKKSHRWSLSREEKDIDYYNAGMSIEKLAQLF